MVVRLRTLQLGQWSERKIHSEVRKVFYFNWTPTWEHSTAFHLVFQVFFVCPGAIIGDGDRKRAPFLVLGLAPWYGTRQSWKTSAHARNLSLVRVDFLFDLFCSCDVLFVWFVPRNGPSNSMDSLLSWVLRTGIIKEVLHTVYWHEGYI